MSVPPGKRYSGFVNYMQAIAPLTVPVAAASASALAASFPEKVAPSMLAKYFCLVKHPARKKLEIGDV